MPGNASYVLLSAVLPGRPPCDIGVLLADPASDRTWVRLRQHYEDVADPEDAEVLEALAEEMPHRIAADGAESYLGWLEDTLSNALRVSGRETVTVDSFSRTADRLYSQHVEPIKVLPFRTHLPLYSLKAAAGSLGEEMESLVEDWVRPPESLRISPEHSKDLFVAHVEGHSMEPRIPDGSLNLFRFHPAGSRQGKLLLIQRFGVLDETARYTVKRYTSRKIETGADWEDVQWAHGQIRLEPLNPAYEAWDVGPEDFAVVAEWLRVLE